MLNRKIFGMIGLIMALASASGLPVRHVAHAQDDPPDTPEPRIVLIEFDPLIPFQIRQNPTIVVYEDGTVIYRNEYVAPDATEEPSDGQPDTGYRTFVLDDDTRATLLAGRNFQELDGLKHYYHSDEPDPIENYLAIWHTNEFASTWVDGDLRNDQTARDAAPTAFLTLYDFLITFVQAEHPEAQMWLPDQLKINLFANQYLPPDARVVEPGGDWPSDWPGLDDPTSRFIGDRGYVMLDASQYAAAVEFITTNHSAANIEGETYWVVLELPFPNQRDWWEDISAAA